MKLKLNDPVLYFPPLNEFVFAMNKKGNIGLAKWDGRCWISFSGEIVDDEIVVWIELWNG